MTLKDLLNSVEIDDYFIGDYDSGKILKPDEHPFDSLLPCRINSITAKNYTPVIWIDLGGDTHAIGVLDI